MSDEWRELYRHAVREADRCGIALGVNLCSGWNAGGPWVTPNMPQRTRFCANHRERTGSHKRLLLNHKAVRDFHHDIACCDAIG